MRREFNKLFTLQLFLISLFGAVYEIKCVFFH